MLVYGDQTRAADPGAVIKQIRRDLTACWQAPPGLERHAALASVFVLAGELVAALLDAEFERSGRDDLSPAHTAGMELLVALAGSIKQSWNTRYQRLEALPDEKLEALGALALPEGVTLKLAEGSAFYAVYPESYLEAARTLAANTTVIGLRSIGAPLAAMVAVGCGASQVFTVRPTGHPFDRRLLVCEELEAAILQGRDSDYAIVDEGPGLSGSSFSGTADWLRARGVAAERIVFLPSHGSDPGAMASPVRRERWRSARREARTFDDVFLAALSSWFEDITGPAIGPLQDLSGGAWRADRLDGPPAYPSQERRKFRLHTATGRWLLKFSGLGSVATEKLERARALHQAGFTAEPIALRHGMLLERWVEDATSPAGPPPLEHLADYIAFRAEAFPTSSPGATLSQLVAMTRANVTEALDADTATALLAPWTETVVDDLQASVRPVHVDARLHWWEWLQTANGLLKADALDHSAAHDLIGPQDCAWDVAGAIVEFELDRAGAKALLSRVATLTPLDLRLVELLLPCYAAFQLGLWTFAAAEDDAASVHCQLYRRRLRQLAGQNRLP